MKNFHKKTALEAEWARLQRREERFLKKIAMEKESVLNRRLEHLVPPKLSSTLDTAFYKAFEVVFEKGTPIIEKTYRKEDRETAYKVSAYAVSLKESRRNLKAFSKRAQNSRAVNLLASGASGIGLGALGIGLPDIPLFTGMLLKSIYEIALNYGFSYDTVREQCFILKLIRVPLLPGEMAVRVDGEVNQLIAENHGGDGSIRMTGEAETSIHEKKAQMRLTAQALSHQLLYMKFLQGIPIAGIVGGAFDAVYLKKITDYADLKYRRRFLLGRGPQNEG